MSKPNLDSFRDAFGCNSSSVWVFCDCGQEFGGEVEDSLIATWYGLISFEGKQYVEACSCWHSRAEHLADWIDCHKHEIANYLRLEKIRLTEFANQHPTVEP